MSSTGKSRAPTIYPTTLRLRWSSPGKRNPPKHGKSNMERMPAGVTYSSMINVVVSCVGGWRYVTFSVNDRNGMVAGQDRKHLTPCQNRWTKEIADHFQRSPVTIGEAIIKVEDLLKRDKSFEKALKRMEENLVRGRKRKYRVSVAWHLSEFNVSFRTALNLALVYWKPQEVTPTVEFAIPPSHPYTRVSGALLVGEAAFVLAHECAHFLLGHTTEEPRVITESSDGVLMPYEYAQRFMGEEIEADRLAAELTKSYLSIHEDDFIKDVGMVGPALFFHWLGFCETLIGSVFLERWQHDVLRMAFAEPYLDKIGENVLLCLHAHPLGTERSKEYLSSVSWDQVSDFTRAVVDASAGIAEHFIADAKNQDRLRAILGERG